MKAIITPLLTLLPKWLQKILGFIGLVIAIWAAFDTYLIDKADTVVAPTRNKVESLEKRHEDFIRATEYHNSSMDAKLNILIEKM